MYKRQEQIASWITEAPFAVKDKYVSLDAGGPTYNVGDKVVIRARIRDLQGKVLENADAVAILLQKGKEIGRIKLKPGKSGGGLYIGSARILDQGLYEVTLRVKELPHIAVKAKTEFVVLKRERPELSDLTCNRNLLQSMAERAHGKYLREEEAQKLKDYLEPLSEAEYTAKEIPLAHSYFWFIPIVILLTVEWFLRKRSGLL